MIQKLKICSLIVAFILGVVFFAEGQNNFKCTYDAALKQITIQDLENGKIILAHYPSFGLWLPDQVFTLGGKSIHGTSIKPAISVDPKENGFDITYVFTNNSRDTASLGELYIGKMKLDSLIFYRNTNYTFQEETFEAKRNIQFLSPAREYPTTTCYSPITILRDKEYVFGISVAYPWEEQKHTINQMIVGTFYEEYPTGWDLIIQLNKNTNGQSYYAYGELAPGQTKTYTVFVRVVNFENKDKDWKKVIEPYKTYFDKTYGSVVYQKDKRPIVGYHGVTDHLMSKENPYGFWNDKNDLDLISHPLRPDDLGFKPTADYLLKLLRFQRYKRVMVWAPSGLYRNNPQRNYPFQFTSQWFATVPNERQKGEPPKMRDGETHFKKLASTIKELGFWWGHSVHISKTWDTPEFEMFDPDNQLHWDLSFKEIDIAARSGVTCLGLDSFNDLPGWFQLKWLDTMRNRTSNKIKFVSELYSFDAVHTRAAFFYADWNVQGRHELADYLVPGHENWLLVIPERHPELNSYIRKWTANGFNPCIMTYFGGQVNPRYKAKR